MSDRIVAAESVDPAVLLALNTANQTETSELYPDSLQDLLAVSWRALAIGEGAAAFVIACAGMIITKIVTHFILLKLNNNGTKDRK